MGIAEIWKLCHYSALNVISRVLKSVQTFGTMWYKYFVFCRWWSVAEKRVVSCGHWIHFVWEPWKIIHFSSKTSISLTVWKDLRMWLQFWPMHVSNKKKQKKNNKTVNCKIIVLPCFSYILNLLHIVNILLLWKGCQSCNRFNMQLFHVCWWILSFERSF